MSYNSKFEFSKNLKIPKNIVLSKTVTRNSPAGQGRAEGKGTIANCSHKLIKSTWSKIGFFDFSFVGRHLESV